MSSAFWLRPGAVTAGFALLLICALLFVQLRDATVSAAELLQRSVAAERSSLRDASVVTHRIINLEERRSERDGWMLRRRIEVWRSAARGVTARRVYDEENRLLVGEWIKADGSRTLLVPGSEAFESEAPAPQVTDLSETATLWRLNPSADDFLKLAGHAETARVEESANAYVILYKEGAWGGGAKNLHEAVLTLNKSDLRGIELRLFVERGGALSEYRFVESEFAREPFDAVPASVFEPERIEASSIEAAPSSEAEKPRTENPAASSNLTNPAHAEVVTASAELEVEVNYLLHRIKANLGEQVSLQRTSDNRLRVEALVETERRKAEILHALRPVAGHPAVRVEVETIDAALKRRGSASSRPTSLTDYEVGQNDAEADTELRRHFKARAGGDEARVDEELLRFSGRVMSRSRQSVQQAAALRRLVASFALQRSGALDASAREKLYRMVHEHTEGFKRNTEMLCRELRPLVASAPAGELRGADSITSDAELLRAAERLVQLSYETDASIRRAFALSAEGQSLAPIKSAQFWISLDEAGRLASAIGSAYQK
jgi:hypothetical protein